MDWEKSKARQVCDACFGGDAASMREHARAYLVDGFAAVRPLGEPFRVLMPGRARHEFWKSALRQLDARLEPQAPLPAGQLPKWTNKAGGESAWRAWADRQKRRCVKRAKEWAAKTGFAGPLPAPGQWHHAILEAIGKSDGRGHFSRLPLSLAWSNPVDPRWPSVEHLDGPASLNIAIEQRVFNDMKTICTEAEFRKAVGHLAAVFLVPLTRVDDYWRPERAFGAGEKTEEPPLPEG